MLISDALSQQFRPVTRTICINEWKRREKMERRIIARLAPPQQIFALMLLAVALMAMRLRSSDSTPFVTANFDY
jgi:hypothetical protein